MYLSPLAGPAVSRPASRAGFIQARAAFSRWAGQGAGGWGREEEVVGEKEKEGREAGLEQVLSSCLKRRLCRGGQMKPDERWYLGSPGLPLKQAGLPPPRHMEGSSQWLGPW